MGMIKYPDRKRQIHDYEGLCHGKMHPTDIDGVIEYKDKAVILWESKFADTEFPTGQKILAERFIRDFERAGKCAVYIVVRHYAENCNEPVYEANSVIESLFTQGKWWRPAREERLRERCSYVTGQIDGTEWC